MHRVVRGIVAGSLIGAAVGLAMLARQRQGMASGMAMKMKPQRMMKPARGTVRMVKDQTKHWTSVLKEGTGAITQRLAHRHS
jgi:hypothetical protein